MATYLAFLRAINLGPTRKFPKDDLRGAIEAAGFEGVETHTASGNVRFDTRMRSRARIEEALERQFRADRGFDVPTVAFSAAEFADLADRAQQIHEAHPGVARHYVYLLKDELGASAKNAVEATSTDEGRMLVAGRAAHALLAPGYQAGKVDPLGAANLLGVATSRNVDVVTTLARKWC
ncbi:DUF1697 domain-containing protein [Microbacterium fluvii]|uniref:DUF1697 domain-containing protein n=1 Tax=Microbacterium fluvii TaxID=415215 RepID=UPI0031E673D5